MNCPNCGSYYEGNIAFCAQCGAPLKNVQNAAPQNNGFSAPQGDGFVAPAPGSAPQHHGYGGPQGGPAYGGPNYGGPGYGGPQGGGFGGGYKAPIQERNIVVCIILSIVTCGIYGIYWMICMANDLNVASDNPNDTSGGMVFVFTLITCGIYGWYWYYKAGEKVGQIHQKVTGYPDKGNGILYLILALFGLGIVNYCLIQSELNKVASM